MILGTAVCRECCVSEHQQAVEHSVCAKRYFIPASAGQNIHHFLPNTMADNGDFKIVY